MRPYEENGLSSLVEKGQRHDNMQTHVYQYMIQRHRYMGHPKAKTKHGGSKLRTMTALLLYLLV